MPDLSENDKAGAAAADRVRMPLRWMVDTLQNEGWPGVRSTVQIEVWVEQLDLLASSARAELERRKVEGDIRPDLPRS